MYPSDGFIKLILLYLTEFWCNGVLERFGLPQSWGCSYIGFYSVIVALLLPIIVYPLIWRCLFQKKHWCHNIAPIFSVCFSLWYFNKSINNDLMLLLDELIVAPGVIHDFVCIEIFVLAFIVDILIISVISLYSCISLQTKIEK